jgi:hypothetical protein
MVDMIQLILAYRPGRWMCMDGTTRAVERQKAIDCFNAPNSLDSVALICTKGLGVGTNCAAAAAAIGYHCHGKPQNDFHATASCITVGRAKQITMYRLITAEGWERATFDCANDTTMGADLEMLLSRFLACQLPDNEIALVAPISSPEADEQQDAITEFPAMDPLIAQPMKQRARGAVKCRGKKGMHVSSATASTLPSCPAARLLRMRR